MSYFVSFIEAENEMWESLKTSNDVLHDYYHKFGVQWIHDNKNRLMNLTGKSITHIENVLRLYRNKDRATGQIIKAFSYTPEQREGLLEAFNLNPSINTVEIGELSDKTGLTRSQITSWFSKQRKIKNGTVVKKKKKARPAYFSIENILSDKFPEKKKKMMEFI
ncbi:hypothetical protein GCK72_006867 [Caenorhabditis remanei]|uniref:Homeobox domain-containing protein n=1 Tax=Caenorhabditis remanei TaxID=31234 RepID=A0A6A5HHQ5_CAERE|nr:hypothetical protein GCK72_006867 [Caenorhabditis remanei]KAF1766909.1 hypothetical protein GCK72_006867 [Caenorhabditis remanei]